MGGGKRKTSKQQANVAAVCVSEPTGSRSRSPSRDGRGRPEIGGVSGPTISDVTDTEKRRREISNTLIQQLKIQIAEKDAQIAVLQQTRRDSLETLAVSPQSVAASAAASTDSPTNSVDVEKDKARIHAAEEQAATLAATNADLQARIHASEEQAATLAAANSDLQARIPALESFLASVQKDHKESKAKFIELEVRAAQDASTILALRAEIAAAKPPPPTASSAATAPAANSGDSKRLKSLEASVVQLQEMVKTREIEMHAGIVEREKLSKEVRERDATVAILKATIKAMETGVVKVLQGPVSSALSMGVISKDVHRFSKDHWASDASVKVCSLPSCEMKFGMIQRKHHCRCCGMIFCAAHSARKMKLSLANHEYDVNGVETRVCDGCYRSANVI